MLYAILKSSEKSLERVNNQDGIKILVKYLAHEPDVIDKTIFQISMNTHYRDLSEYDLETSSFISIDDGPLLQPAEWTSTGDNHHVKGRMTFYRPASLTLSGVTFHS